MVAYRRVFGGHELGFRAGRKANGNMHQPCYTRRRIRVPTSTLTGFDDLWNRHLVLILWPGWLLAEFLDQLKNSLGWRGWLLLDTRRNLRLPNDTLWAPT